MDVPSQIIAIARSEVDHKDEHILVQVSFNSSGSVKLIATDGEGAYAARLTRSEIERDCRASSDDWFSVFRSVMLDQADITDVDVSAICKDSRITILFRQKMEIPLKLYTFDMPYVEDYELILFDWALQLTQTLKMERTTFRSIEKTHTQAKSAVQIVEDDLQQVRARMSLQENRLLEKFAILLNSKKKKIRQLRDHGSDASNAEYKSGTTKRTKTDHTPLDSQASDSAGDIHTDSEGTSDRDSESHLQNGPDSMATENEEGATDMHVNKEDDSNDEDDEDDDEEL